MCMYLCPICYCVNIGCTFCIKIMLSKISFSISLSRISLPLIWFHLFYYTALIQHIMRLRYFIVENKEKFNNPRKGKTYSFMS